MSSDAQAPSPPPAAPLDQRYRSLFDRRSVVGALVVLAALCFFGFGLTAIDEAVKRASGFDVGTAYAVSDTVSFTPVAGWVIDPAATSPGSVVTASKNGVTMKVEALVLQPGQSVEQLAGIFNDSDEQNGEYVTVSGLESFVTTDGRNGVTWDAHGPKNAAHSWAVANGPSLAFMPVRGPAASWASVEAELEEMAKSIVVVPPAAEAAP